MDKKTAGGVLLGVLWTVGVGCVFALIQNSSLTSTSVVVLGIVGGISFTCVSFWHGWHRAPMPIGIPVKVVLLLLVIWVPMGWLCYRAWPVREYEVVVTFKDSPLFTTKRKEKIKGQLDDYYRYMRGIGFDLQKEIPPIGIVPAGAPMGAGGSYGPPPPNGYSQYPAYASQISISENTIDSPNVILEMYSSSIFSRMMLWPNSWKTNISRSEAEDDEIAEWIYQCYYPASFLGSPKVCEGVPGQKWLDALWEIRQQYGQEYTDSLMYYTLKLWGDGPSKYSDSFDRFFRMKMLSGEFVKDNDVQDRANKLNQIFKRHGIDTALP